ncbi:hypothetical protein [Domibacillus epiphyticus]|uniref:hypothetical protein n=1 Tax=Domibacillus epiphyticus TaxID=1714355 RepID=UPI001300E481|nr:hypothetical protein [Domibacillus epiphyticus]
MDIDIRKKVLLLITFILTAKLYASAIITLDPLNPPRNLVISEPQKVFIERWP